MRQKLKPLVFLPAVIVMCIIFALSSQTASESRTISYRAGERIVKKVNMGTKRGWSKKELRKLARKVGKIFRKCAHAFEYLVLAVTVYFPLYVYDMRGRKLFLVSLIFCICFAASDEFHQYFVPGRAAAVTDVLIDSAGALLGILIMGVILKTKAVRKLLRLTGSAQETL